MLDTKERAGYLGIAMKTRKIQVTLDEARYQALVRVAEREEKKLAAVVRESIEKYLVGPESAREKRASLQALFALDAPVPASYETWEREYSRLKTEAPPKAPLRGGGRARSRNGVARSKSRGRR
jgi:hypothetical protein